MTPTVLEKIKIDKRSALPITTQLMQSFKMMMLNHDITYMDQMPTIPDLASFLKIRKSDIENAYHVLMSEKYIVKKEQNYYVDFFHFSANFFLRLIKLYDAIKDMGMTPSMKTLIKKTTFLPKEFHVNEKISMDEKYYQIKRLYLGNDTPLIILDTYLPVSRFEGLINYINDGEALYETLYKYYQTPVVSSKRTFSVINLDKETSKTLKTMPHTASYYGASISYDRHHQIVDFTRSWSTINYFFEIELEREDIEKAIKHHLYFI